MAIVQHLKTYSIRAPISSHWKKVTCEQIGCSHYANGWRVRVDTLSPDMLHAATHSGRSYHRATVSQNETWLVFDANQPCFRADTHRVRVSRPEIYQVRDWNVSTGRGTTKVFRSPDDWVGDFSGNQDRINRFLTRA